jgi:hypothetical protein
MRLLNLSCLFGLSHPIRGGVVLGVEPVAELDRDGDGLFGSEERRVGGDRRRFRFARAREARRLEIDEIRESQNSVSESP